MADYYTQGAGLYDIEDVQETSNLLNKLKNYFQYIQTLGDDESRDPLAYKHKEVVTLVSDLIENSYEDYVFEFGEELNNFVVTDDGYLYYDNGFDISPDVVGDILRIFLQIEPEKITWRLTYACTCSKPRPDGFGGGIIVATKDKSDVWGVESLYDELYRIANDDNRVALK